MYKWHKHNESSSFLSQIKSKTGDPSWQQTVLHAVIQGPCPPLPLPSSLGVHDCWAVLSVGNVWSVTCGRFYFGGQSIPLAGTQASGQADSHGPGMVGTGGWCHLSSTPTTLHTALSAAEAANVSAPWRRSHWRCRGEG